MSVINTNSKSIIAQNALTVNNRSMSKVMEQLSTGKRINSASDDAAGMAISNKMTSQIRGLNQAVRNANDGISMIQTAEGATVEITNMLQRMRELAVQSASDTNTQEERNYLNDEFVQLKNEMNRIADKTQWNGVGVLDANANLGSAAGAGGRDIAFQVGANANDTITLNMKSFKTTDAGATSEKIGYNFAAATDLADTDKLNLTMTINGVSTTFSVAFNNTATTASSPNITEFNTGKTTAAGATTLAASLQTALRQNTSLQNISVTANGAGFLTFEDPEGRQITGITTSETAVASLKTDQGAVAEIQNGTTGAGVFSNSAALNGSTITSKANANTAITALDAAMVNVNTERSKMGAVINRLTYAADNLTNVSQNASASRSRVLDTDYATATTELARTQIISQAATAMLAQANQAPQTVLSLLR
jgi:flagellin